ncbi:DUF3953 domain-containing protein [Bacillus sp. FJAT-53711]|uniref:DUF3953 domain-containing protein n=1 Tax=Bacillus yunxiaonensis TaxID=3127665 RepID=A0ABU8G1D4_9BACI
MLKILRITFPIITLLLATFGFFTDNIPFILPYMLISLGLMCFISSIAEFQKQQTANGIFLFLTGAFVLYVPLSQFFH